MKDEAWNIEKKDFMPLCEKLLITINEHFKGMIGSKEGLIIHASLNIMTNSNSDFLKGRGIHVTKTLEKLEGGL